MFFIQYNLRAPLVPLYLDLVKVGKRTDNRYLCSFFLDLDERILKQQLEEEERKRQRRERKKEKKVSLMEFSTILLHTGVFS